MTRIAASILLLVALFQMPVQSAFRFGENFDDFDPSRFRTKIPNKNTEVRNSALWTRGKSGGKYPPMVYLDVAGKDLEISFRYRHLQKGGMIWFFVDGDDGFGSVDHLLRVKLLRTGVQLQIDAHSLDPKHPDRQNNGRPADKVSGAYRLNVRLPQEKLDLSANLWRTVSLAFKGDTVDIALDGETWTRTLKHACFNATKRKLLWMQNGGEKGIEIDDIRIREIPSELKWSLVKSGVTNSIRGISAVSQNVCWIGTKSGVARTVDGGKNWRFSKIGGDDLDFRDLHAFAAKRCVAMSAGTGRASRIYLTKDGGTTWKLTHQNTEPKGFFNGFAFRDDKHAMLAGDVVGGRLFL
ncbi:MAG: WD40/YVTN/BNR-like repeat-containing protein, partial [Limisphaerales bacterium]